MKLNPSYLVAGVAVAAIVVWFALGTSAGDDDIYSDVEQRNARTEAVLPTVVIRSVVAQPHEIRLSTYGRTQANRMVEVKAKTPGSVSATPIAEGTPVRRGQIICRQDTDARQAVVDQAKAQLAKTEADLNATTVLVEKGYRSPTQLNSDKAAVDAARAALAQAEIELGNIVMRAPFDGIYEKRLAEVGDFLSPGQPCGLVVELDPLRVEVELTEAQVGQVSVGQPVDVSLATGQMVTGEIAFIESVANPATRTFEVETHIQNPDGLLKAGVSATINVRTGDAMASLVPSGILTLDENGMLGIRYVDASDTVRFARTQQVDETEGGLWVTGLPERARIIVEGQDYVSVGTQVDPRFEDMSRNGSGVIASGGDITARARLD